MWIASSQIFPWKSILCVAICFSFVLNSLLTRDINIYSPLLSLPLYANKHTLIFLFPLLSISSFPLTPWLWFQAMKVQLSWTRYSLESLLHIFRFSCVFCSWYLLLVLGFDEWVPYIVKLDNWCESKPNTKTHLPRLRLSRGFLTFCELFNGG